MVNRLLTEEAAGAVVAHVNITDRKLTEEALRETLKDELEVLSKIILQEYRRRMHFVGKLLSEAMRNPDVGSIFYRTFVKQGRLLFTEFLNARKRHGELRDDLDVEAVAALFLLYRELLSLRRSRKMTHVRSREVDHQGGSPMKHASNPETPLPDVPTVVLSGSARGRAPA